MGAQINSTFSTYDGTFSTIKNQFPLNHKNIPIFKQTFDGSNSLIVDSTKNLIKIPGHFFTTGEELIYSNLGVGTSESIGIATTSIAGIGLTDKLPKSVYAIKVSESSIRFASSVENALKFIPVPLTISSVGIGTSHSLTSKNENSRVLISIDNVIQSPIVSTAITSSLINQITRLQNLFFVSDTNSFFNGDLIKINDEIMILDSVGYGATNAFLVRRTTMGTVGSSHSTGSLITKIKGDYNITNSAINFRTAPYGLKPVEYSTVSPDEVDYSGISTSSIFSGRSFIRSAIPNTSEEPYSKNYIFDDISLGFSGYSTSFTLKSNGNNVTDISSDNSVILVNQIFQGPQGLNFPVNVIGDYTLKENVGITSILFTGSISSTSYDINTANVPSGGVIISVASTPGLGYQPLVSAGGTAIISGLGTVSSISIGNSGSGYRSGLQSVRVGVKTEDLEDTNITYIGIASVLNGNIVSVAITNPGVGYTFTNPPIVVFDSPLSYSNIPLKYSSSSIAGIGTEATINIVVGQGSSIIDFEIQNTGYGYKSGEILTVGVGGTVGIPTSFGITFNEFQITVDRTYSDSFSGWSLGSLLVLDAFDELFDGNSTSFQIKLNGSPRSIKSKKGSNIDIQATLLIFINDILQVPGKGYTFNGGSYITFTEAPKPGDTSKILFYQGTSSVDVIDVDVLETIKPGDNVRLNDDNFAYSEEERIVMSVNSIDSIDTNSYPGPGINVDTNYTRPLIWCKQTDDLFIDGKPITKDRIWYEPLIYPNTKIIQSVGIGSTVIFVESVKTFFDSAKENSSKQNKIKIVSQDNLVGASATAIVSTAGTITSISITNDGNGYISAPTVIFADPINIGDFVSIASTIGTIGISTNIITGINTVGITTGLIVQNEYVPTGTSVVSLGPSRVGLGTTTTNVGIATTIFEFIRNYKKATATSSITSGIVTSIRITNPGFGYTSTNPPIVIIESPKISDYVEDISLVTYTGDFGIISGVSTVSVGVASTGIVFDLVIPKDSFLRDSSIVGTAITVSGIQTGYYFVVYNSNIGYGVTSLRSNGSIVSIGNSFLDNVYQVAAVSIAQTSVPGLGVTHVAKVTVSVRNYNGLVGTGHSEFFGEFSWGRISAPFRSNPKDFEFYNNGLVGISTSPIVERYNPLNYSKYI